MKWLLIFLILSSSPFVFLPEKALAITADEYATQVIQKDLPRSLRWFEKISGVTSPNPLELQDLYNAAIPAPQANWQNGISIKGSIERMLLLLEGARFFPALSEASPQFQSDYELVRKVLQATKDQTEHFKFGESAEVLYQQWNEVGVTDFPKFAQTLTSVLSQVQVLLKTPVAAAIPGVEMVETRVPEAPAAADSGESVQSSFADTSVPVSSNNGGPGSSDETAANFGDESFQNFDVQRFFSYVEASERGRVAPECETARSWSTDQAPRCTRDEEPGCDRNYARQCKKLH